MSIKRNISLVLVSILVAFGVTIGLSSPATAAMAPVKVEVVQTLTDDEPAIVRFKNPTNNYKVRILAQEEMTGTVVLNQKLRGGQTVRAVTDSPELFVLIEAKWEGKWHTIARGIVNTYDGTVDLS